MTLNYLSFQRYFFLSRFAFYRKSGTTLSYYITHVCANVENDDELSDLTLLQDDDKLVMTVTMSEMTVNHISPDWRPLYRQHGGQIVSCLYWIARNDVELQPGLRRGSILASIRTILRLND